MADTIGAINPLRYRGYYYDTETELYYLQSRYYSPDLMRFISQDDVKLSNAQGEPLGSNLYAYCLNNPVMNSDYTGSFIIATRIITCVLGALFGAATYMVSFLIDKYIFQENPNFSWWELFKNIIVGAISGALSGVNISRLLSMVIDFSSEFITGYAKGKIIEALICATIMGVISFATSGNKTILNNKTLKHYSKTLYKKLSVRKIKDGIKQFLTRTSKYICDYISDSFLSSFFSLLTSKTYKAVQRR